jgi:ABC-2 type transport system permease protein
MLGVITNAFSNVASVTYMAKFQRNIEEVLVAPVPAWAVTLGFASGGVIRGLMIAIIIFFTTFFFVDIPVAHPLIAITVIILTTLAFSFMGLVTGLYAKNFDGVSIVPTFILTPLTYL